MHSKVCAYCGVSTEDRIGRKYCSFVCYNIDRTGKKFSEAHKKKLSDKKWLGENAGYQAKHFWMRKIFGNPPVCEHCGIVGEYRLGRWPKGQWSIDWANISGEYRRDRDDFIGLCRSCHMKYDAAQIKMKKSKSISEIVLS